MSDVFAEIRLRLQSLTLATEALRRGSDASRRAILEDRARSLARPIAVTAERGTEAVTFGLGQERYALSMGWVREVSRPPPITRIPGTPPLVRGVCHHRGEVLAVFDLHELLPGAPAETSEQERLLVLGDGRAELGVVVDDVFDLIRVSSSELRAVDTARPEGSDWVLGVGPQGVIVLDGRALLSDGRLFVDRSDDTDVKGARAS